MLGDEDIQKLRQTLQTSGWRDVVMKAVKERKDRMVEIGYMLPAERPKPYHDLEDAKVISLTQGEARCCDWLLRHFDTEVMVYDQNRRSDELAGHGA